jgi:alkanesulfonate monooxygenase SsuD/methylene tetrahydromethanopterin reductase-like flavin-dependent oxidoreductase (luciferase family)
MVTFLKEALTGEKVTREYDTFHVDGFRLAAVPDQTPPILVAALREKMLRMAGSVGDGAILNWLSAEDVTRVAPYVHDGGDGKEIACRIFVCPSEDADEVRAQARRFIAAYLNVEVYARFHEWLGRDDALAGMWERWRAGDRRGSLEQISDEVVDELIVHGSPDACRAHVRRYVEAGVHTPIIAVMPWGVDPLQAALALAPTEVAR